MLLLAVLRTSRHPQKCIHAFPRYANPFAKEAAILAVSTLVAIKYSHFCL